MARSFRNIVLLILCAAWWGGMIILGLRWSLNVRLGRMRGVMGWKVGQRKIIFRRGLIIVMERWIAWWGWFVREVKWAIVLIYVLNPKYVKLRVILYFHIVLTAKFIIGKPIWLVVIKNQNVWIHLIYLNLYLHLYMIEQVNLGQMKLFYLSITLIFP